MSGRYGREESSRQDVCIKFGIKIDTRPEGGAGGLIGSPSQSVQFSSVAEEGLESICIFHTIMVTANNWISISFQSAISDWPSKWSA